MAGCYEEWVYDETQKTDVVKLELKIWGHPNSAKIKGDAPAMRCVMVRTAAMDTSATLRKKKK